jgi:hypothetical protein
VTTRTALQRLVISAYPPSFRRRYGDELATLVADDGSRWRDVVDLALGVGRAWTAPVFAGTADEQRRSRLQATTITVLAAWCASVVAAGGFAKAVDDPPLHALHGAAWAAYDVGAVVLEATAAAVLLTGFAFWLTVVVPALRTARRDVVVPALAPALFVAGWLGVTALVALFVHREMPPSGVALMWPRDALVLAVFVAWLAVTLATVVGCAAGAALALRRAKLSLTRLTLSTVVAAVAAVGITALAAASAVCLALLVRAGAGLDAPDAILDIGSVVMLLGAAAVSVVSVVRCFGVLRSGPERSLGATV